MQTYKVPVGFINQGEFDTEKGRLSCIFSPRKDKLGQYPAFCDNAFGRLEPGDIFGLEESGPLMWVNQHFTQPKPRDLHFGILWMRHPHRSDWITLESSPAGHGIRPGLLSYHLPGPIDIYRVDAEAELRHNTPWALNDWASQSKTEKTYTTYGFFDFVGFVGSGLTSWAKILFKEHRLRALTAAEVSLFYKLDRSIICTAAAWLSYKLCGFDLEQEIWLRKWRLGGVIKRVFIGGKMVIPPPQPKVAPIPCVFEEALQVGILELLYHR